MHIAYVYLKLGEAKFTRIATFDGGLGLTYVQKLVDPSPSAQEGDFVVGMTYFSLKFVEVYLHNLVAALRALSKENHIESRPRAFITIASSWLVAAMKNNGESEADIAAADQSHCLVSVSTGNGSYHVNRKSALTGEMEDANLPLKDVDATDYVIAGVARAIDSHYERYTTNFSRVSFTRNDTLNPHHNDESYNNYTTEDVHDDNYHTPETHFMGAKRLRFPGLDMWIVLSLDEETVLGEIPNATREVHTRIDLERDDTMSDIDEDRLRSRIITVAVGCVIVFLTVMASFRVIQPIKVLQQQMQLVASMDLNSLDLESTSMFYEIRKMQYHFRKMVEHLIEYRAYVPSAVLEGASTEQRKIVRPPTGKVALVFTDIQGSTALWKMSAGDMNDAMEIHNEVIRDVCIEFEGYEVKTIGDSFMVSFPCPVAAVNFGLHVQTRFQKRKWPAGLNLPESGLVIRIGVNYGPTIAEQNPVTGRVDYRGSTVNLASRVEGKAKGGTVCITSDTYAAVKSSMVTLGGPAFCHFGIHEVKGLGDGHELILMVPEALKCRLNDSESDCFRWARGPNSYAEPSQSSHQTQQNGRTPPQSPYYRSSGDSGTSTSSHERSGAKGPRVGKALCALQVSRAHVTVAVCRLVCIISFSFTQGIRVVMNEKKRQKKISEDNSSGKNVSLV